MRYTLHLVWSFSAFDFTIGCFLQNVRACHPATGGASFGGVQNSVNLLEARRAG